MQSIEMVSVTGDDRSTFHTDIQCALAMSIDYASHTLYWIDQCNFAIEALRLDGDSSTHTYPFNALIFFPSSVTVYHDLIFWAAASGLFRANQSDSGSGSVQIHTTVNTRATGVQVVHPSQQPPGKGCVPMATV